MTGEWTFQLIAGFSLLSALSISVYFRHRAEREGGKMARVEGRWLLVLLRLVGLAAILPLLAYLVQPAWVAWARVELPLWLRWVGAGGVMLMLPALYWLFATIRNNISPLATTRQGHQLVTHGPYRWIRHPLYTFGSIFFLSLAVMTGLWWLAALMALGGIGLAWRTPREERHLLAAFGDDYRQYMARTGRYLPRLR